jgi:predicted lipoprotein with Yx(FWY)xxD motif
MKSRLVLAVIALLIGACGEGGTTETTGGEAGATTTAAESMTGVHVADTEAGSALVGPDGLTLYVFTSDTDGESTCYDACADLWPPLPGDTEISADLDASLFATTTRTDGSEQLTVNGMPLYQYEPDDAPGDAKGQGFNGVWFVVDAGGSIVEAAASSDAAIGDDYGYGG